MLNSLYRNGDVNEAVILIAAFDLTAEDYDKLRSGAGPFGRDIRFVDVTPAMLGSVAERAWEAHYSLPIFGRLFLHDLIERSGARLLTLDSDLVVNGTVRPLFELNLLGNYVAAAHDVPRTDDLDYFNSGVMLIDVDRYRHYRVPERCLQWLASQEHRPRWPDQDALNDVVGHQWFRLDKTWNRNFCGHNFDPEPLTSDFYEKAKIAHFTGQSKPWNDAGHVGRDLYERYRASYKRDRATYLATKNHVDTNFVVTLFEILLGRSPSSLSEVTPLRRMTARQAVRSVLHTPEFAAETLLPLKLDVPFVPGMFQDAPALRHLAFARERLLLHHASGKVVEFAQTWRQLLLALLSDPFFRTAYDLQSILALADAVTTHRPETGVTLARPARQPNQT